jgi:restriction endonuclease S subunit
LRVVPNESLIDAGYLNCFLASDYGFHQLLKYKYGSVIDEIDDKNIATVQVPIPSDKQQKEIGDLVRKAYDYRADAIRLEDEAQEILTQALTKNK